MPHKNDKHWTRYPYTVQMKLTVEQWMRVREYLSVILEPMLSVILEPINKQRINTLYKKTYMVMCYEQSVPLEYLLVMCETPESAMAAILRFVGFMTTYMDKQAIDHPQADFHNMVMDLIPKFVVNKDMCQQLRNSAINTTIYKL